MPKERTCKPCGTKFVAIDKPRIFRVCPKCEKKTTTCKCGCGSEISAFSVWGDPRSFAYGHVHKAKRNDFIESIPPKLCLCGCGNEIDLANRIGRKIPDYIYGHSSSVTRNRSKKNCSTCGKEIEVIPCKTSIKKYCSRDCYRQAKTQFKGTFKECLLCKTTFPVKHKTNRFCTKECYYKWCRQGNHPDRVRVQVECVFCGKAFEKVPSQVEKYQNHYCSPSCSSKAKSLQMRGLEIGEAEPQECRYYSRASWRRTRQLALERDNFACIACGMTNDEHLKQHFCGLHVDHIIPRRQGGTDDLSNLQTLCASHHSQKTCQGL